MSPANFGNWGFAASRNDLFEVKTFRADLHVHTVVSPCAEVEMIPPLIVEGALEKQIDLIAITDHNSTANIEAVLRAAAGTGLFVLPGMEIQTREDIHSICIFDTLKQAIQFQEIVDRALPGLVNDPEHFGEQFVVDESGDFVRREERLLITACSMSIDEAFNIVKSIGGLFIPAHINRKSFGLIASLGFVPPEIPFEALEISRHITQEQARLTIPGVKNIPLIQDGDVHRLDEFLGTLLLTLDHPSVSEIRKAFRSESGRSFSISSLVG